jgi:F0F1-type ATP synthase delta subunit
VCAAKIKEAMAAGNREAAMRVLKVKKLKEAQRDKLRNQIHDLTSTAAAIETEAQNAAFVAAIAEGTAALQRMQEELPLEKVQAVMDATADAVDAAREMDEAIIASAASLTAGAWPCVGVSECVRAGCVCARVCELAAHVVGLCSTLLCRDSVVLRRRRAETA